ncbi:MAG: 3-oxoacyl-ACP synthase III [Planctomycetia bacterium]|nr:3-oxoacyl-ACP synthase III [Planctomycetia bacterium]
MKYNNVYIEPFICRLPDEIVTTDALEQRLAPLYTRLKLPYGRLELMTGIRERRIWPAGRLPGDESVATVQKLLDAASFDPNEVGAFIHASVCRDYQEPATACHVHQRLKLSQQCAVFDISNACLGLLTGMVQVANMIELGQISAGIVVGTETSRSLMETTITRLLTDTTLDRRSIKEIFASLTIGSGSAAVLLTNRDLTRSGRRLLGGVVQANTHWSHLCRSEVDATAGGTADGIYMRTDSERLMAEGVATAKIAFDRFLTELNWTGNAIDRTFCHQVGKAHQKLLFDTLELDTAKNFVTLPFLGNTGSVALPTAAALGFESGFVQPGDQIALLGIGSGINVIMLGIGPASN